MDETTSVEQHFRRWFTDYIDAARQAGHGRGVTPLEIAELYDVLAGDIARLPPDWSGDWVEAAVRVALGC